MNARNQLLAAPPYQVEQALQRVGHDLRIARIRRKLTIADAAARIGTGPRAVRDAEHGKASTAIAVYVALLWLFDMLQPFDEIASPLKDEQGLALAGANEKVRARKGKGLDNDF